MIMAASAILSFSSCQDKGTTDPEQDGPSVEWASNPEFKTLVFVGVDD